MELLHLNILKKCGMPQSPELFDPPHSSAITQVACANLYNAGGWIHVRKDLNMKRLLGLLLVMGMVGCGGGDTSPKSSQAKSDEPPVQTVDLSRTVERGGLRYEVNSETPFTGVAVDKYENGQK